MVLSLILKNFLEEFLKFVKNKTNYLVIGSILGIDTALARGMGQNNITTSFASPPKVFFNGKKIMINSFRDYCEMYLDSENWLKGSIEYENEQFQHLGSVVTNNGYSDWATTAIDASVKSMWYRFSRREDDYCIECSYDGIHFKQMRICHMWNGNGTIRFGIYACSPEDSSFKAIFTNMQITECQWRAHDGQSPDD